MSRLLRCALAMAVLMGTAIFVNSQAPMGALPLLWGTYVHQVSVGPGVNLPALVTFNLDETVTVSSGLMFGGLPGSTDRMSPVHGIWRFTGPRKVGATTYFFTFDVNGILTGYQRNRCTLNFSRDFKSYEGNEFMETTSCSSPFACPDPMDPGTVWTALPGQPAGGFVTTGKRVQWLPAGPLL